MNNNVGYITYCRSILFILLHLLCVHLFAASKNAIKIHENKKECYYKRNDNTTGLAYLKDSLIAGQYKFYIARDKNLSREGLVVDILDTLYIVVPIENEELYFTPISRYCHIRKNFDSYFYDIVEEKFIKGASGFSKKLIEGVSNDRGYYISDGKVILFEDNSRIVAPNDSYGIRNDKDSLLEVKVGSSLYQMTKVDISSVWKVNSFCLLEDSVLGGYLISEILSDTAIVATAPNNLETVVIRFDDTGYDTLRIPNYSKLRGIFGTDRYLFGAMSDSLCYIYDIINKMQFQLNDTDGWCSYDNILYLGERYREPIFLFDKNYLLGTKGFRCSLDNGLEIDPEKCKPDGRVFVRESESAGAYVRLKDFLYNKILISIFDPDNDCVESFRLKDKDSDEDDLYYQSVFCYSIPKLDYKEKLKQHILYWISECISFSRDYTRMFIPSKQNTEYDVLDYYKRLFISDIYASGEDSFLWGGDETVCVEKVLDTKNIVSFRFEYNNRLGGGTGFGDVYAASFDKKTNRRIKLDDIILPEARPVIEAYLRDLAEMEVEDSLINTCVALGSEGILFVFGRYVISGNWTRTINVPYDIVKQWLLIPYDFEKSNLKRVKLKFVDHLEEENKIPCYYLTTDLAKKYQEKWFYNTRRDEPIELCVNGGYNRKNAIKLMDTEPMQAIEIIDWLACEQGKTRNSWVYDGLMKLAKVSLAKKYVRDNDNLTARECLEEIISYGDSLNRFFGEDLVTENGQYYYIDALLEMCNIASKQNDQPTLIDCHKKISNSLPDHIRMCFSRYTREKRTKLWDLYREWFFSDIHKAAFSTKDSVLLKSAYDALLFGKGLLLNTEVALRNHILNRGKEEVVNLLFEYDRLKETRRSLGRSRRGGLIKDLEDGINDVESKLVSEYLYFDGISLQSINTDHILGNMNEDEIAIEFLDIKERKDTIYYALILKKGSSVPIIKRLFASSQLNSVPFDKYEFGELYNLVWRPLENELHNCKKVFFSPSGKLYTIPIEYAINPKSNRAFYDDYHIYRLSSTREIVLARDSTYRQERADGISLLVGGLDYNYSCNMDKNINENIVSSTILRGALSRKSKIRNLPGTKEEILGIIPYVKVLNKTKPVVILTDSMGTEYNFRESVNNRVLNLHVATHGFYLSDKDFSNLDRDSYFLSIGKNIRDIEENSLVRSGLIFAGVNNALKGRGVISDYDDGLLTTLEISMLDFNDVDLVVLSACETGEGDVSSEGVFGLQRGFKKAGARTLLLSLWPVNDDATKVLMVKFYEQLSLTHDKRLALKTAQHYLRNYNKGKYADPMYWAAFIILDGIQ